jgi:hypothetical protein
MHIHECARGQKHERVGRSVGRSVGRVVPTTGRRRGAERDGARARYLVDVDGSLKEAARDAVISGARR